MEAGSGKLRKEATEQEWLTQSLAHAMTQVEAMMGVLPCAILVGFSKQPQQEETHDIKAKGLLLLLLGEEQDQF